MHAFSAILVTLVVALAGRGAAQGTVCGNVIVDTVGECRGANSQVCYNGDGSILCTCSGSNVSHAT